MIPFGPLNHPVGGCVVQNGAIFPRWGRVMRMSCDSFPFQHWYFEGHCSALDHFFPFRNNGHRWGKCMSETCPGLGSVTCPGIHPLKACCVYIACLCSCNCAGLDFRKSAESNSVSQSVNRFSSIVEEQLQEKVSFHTLT